MVFLHYGFTAALMVLSALVMAQAAPLADRLRLLSPPARAVLKRSTPAAPRYVVYSDYGTLPSTADIQGYNVFALTFLRCSGPVDQAQNWEQLSAGQISSYLQAYNDAGISLIVSAFGSADEPTSNGFDPVETANSMAAWVIQYGLQGVDVDYEDFSAFSGGGGSAENWLISYTQQLRQQLPQGQYIISHAPIAPWFSPGAWSGGGYLAVDQSVGSLIDWYNVQNLNPPSVVEGDSEYSTCSGLLEYSSSSWPESSLFQIAANGVSPDKLVIGKPATPSDDYSGGYIDPPTLASCVSQANSQGWNAGVMGWQYPDAASSWIATVTS